MFNPTYPTGKLAGLAASLYSRELRGLNEDDQLKAFVDEARKQGINFVRACHHPEYDYSIDGDLFIRA